MTNANDPSPTHHTAHFSEGGLDPMNQESKYAARSISSGKKRKNDVMSIEGTAATEECQSTCCSPIISYSYNLKEIHNVENIRASTSTVTNLKRTVSNSSKTFTTSTTTAEAKAMPSQRAKRLQFSIEQISSLRYAYVDENKRIFQIIHQGTTNGELAKVAKEQKRRKSKRETPLTMHLIGATNNEIIRELDDGEQIPNWFQRKRDVKITDAEVHRRALELLHQASKNSEDNASNKLHYPIFTEPNEKQLFLAYNALVQFLPEGDCESFHSVLTANKYYEYFKPKKVKVILLAESHVYTEESISRHGPFINLEGYNGPKDFVQLVYCLGYGGKSILQSRKSGDEKIELPKGADTGTAQFWKLFEACSGIGPGQDGVYGSKVLKKNEPNEEARIRNKLHILLRLKERGIWLLDTSIIGWYIQQDIEYNITMGSKNVHKLAKARPPKRMKKDTLILSWELYTKHVVRKAFLEGNLKLLIPIGSEVVNFITRERFEEAVDNNPSLVHNGIPAMNAWDKGKDRLNDRLKDLATLVNEMIG